MNNSSYWCIIQSNMKDFGLFVTILILAPLCLASTHLTRTVKREVKKVSCGNITHHVIHETATSTSNKNDVIHYVWCAINRPTILIKHVFNKTTLKVNNQSICDQKGLAFEFTPDNSGISGLILTKVFSYEDPDGTVNFNTDNIKYEVADNYRWEYINDKAEDSAIFNGTTRHYPAGGNIMFKVQAHTKTTNADEWPHNPVNANLTEFTLGLNKLPGISGVVHSRYAVEVVVFRTGGSRSVSYDTKEYLDDEYTPGIFNIWSADLQSGGDKSYATWKPVAYDKPERSRKNQIFARNHGSSDKLDKSGSFQPYAGNITWSIVKGLPDVRFFGVNVTFGSSKDDVYKGNKSVITWVGMVGSGKPPCDTYSDTTLAIIISGLGAPGIVILIAIFVLLIRRVRLSRRSKYSQIN
ncbi:glycosylated lysosomal membrane protein A-like isoform X2 [Hydractinia symbiolongicarpus]|uniref:glycosylated lysosomal membrane protein A-like isoform X2 n=1 Tax=Hydractinia symbiolongicarpus TaxID=13093 RepID=UPI00254AF430|nr:glycosylated lysosomal membrane protein A-like isoform X2 [Hydractinia symbiolongicarpus]